MKTIQKLTLGLLTVVATATSGFSSGTITLDVASGTATHSGLINADLVKKTSAGTLVLSNATNAIDVLEIQQGQVHISATGNLGGTVAFTTTNDNTLFATANGIEIPALALGDSSTGVRGVLDINNYSVKLAGALSYAGELAISGPSGLLTAAYDNSASSTPMKINTDATVAVGSAAVTLADASVVSNAKLPNAALDVYGILKITGVLAGCAPGTAVVRSGATVLVDPALAVPAAGNSSSSDLFGSLEFQTGSILKLGAGASWARNISVGTAL
jgi:hypothetical protein